MTYSEAFEYLLEKEVSAYELHIFSGKAQTGLRSVLNGKTKNPGRKTKEVIIKYAKKLKAEENLETTALEQTGMSVEQIEEWVLINKTAFFQRKKMSDLLENLFSKRMVAISRSPKLFAKYFKDFIKK